MNAFSISAPYFLNGHHNIIGLAMADEANQAIMNTGISTDRDAVESVLSGYPDAALFGLTVDVTEVESGRNALAANERDGVYVCEAPAGADVLVNMDFYNALATATETIYGDVSDEVAALIEAEYGIH